MRLASVVMLLLTASAAFAHFTVLTPRGGPWGTRGEPVSFGVWYGHPFELDRVPISRPVRFVAHPPTGEAIDLTDAIQTAETNSSETDASTSNEWRVDYTPQTRGDHILLLETAPIAHGNDITRDFTKYVLHVPAVQNGWDRVLGEPLEIVPYTRPYGIPTHTSFRAQVLVDGIPHSNAHVEIEHLNTEAPDPLPPEPFITRVERTNSNGEFAVTLDEPGYWLLSVSHTPSSENSENGASELGSTETIRASLWVYVGR